MYSMRSLILQLEVISLLNALPQMSESMAAPRPPLWVDAICSNQADDEEKAVHVPLMGEIYENGKRILVWSGDAADYSDLAMDSFGQISEEVADGVLCKGYKSNFLCSPTSFSLAKVICLLNGVRQRCYGFIPEAHNPLVVKATNLLIGDEGIGPQAGPPSMGREDDDDDDCVGFHKFFRLNQSSGVVEKGAQLQDRINICNLHKHSRCATIPKHGPPKHDPVAAARSIHIRQSLDASTLNTWRDVISRTCRKGADPYSAKAKEWQGSSWQSAVLGLG